MAKRNPEIAQSLAHASQQTGIPVSMLKQARGAGCPAFRGCRVDLAVLREWLDENPDIYTAG